MIQCLLPRTVALFLTQQLYSIIWGKSDRFKAVGNLPHIYYKDAVKMVTNKVFLSHQGFAGWEITLLVSGPFALFMGGGSKGFFLGILFVNP